jgi:hypothetical protein
VLARGADVPALHAARVLGALSDLGEGLAALADATDPAELA